MVLGAADSDVGDVLAFSVVAQPTKGEVVCDGTFGEDCTYTAGPGQTGSDSFTFKANDGTADSNIATVSITITNQAPVADAIAASAPRGVATEIVTTGRHDPCVGLRAVPIAEAMLALVLMDHYLCNRAQNADLRPGGPVLPAQAAP